MSLPAMSLLAVNTSSCELWTSSACVPLVEFCDHVKSIASTGLDLLEFGLDPPAKDLLQKFDRIVSWYGSSRLEFRETVRHLPITFHPAVPQDASTHAVDFYLTHAGGPHGAIPILKGFATEPKRNFVACQPFSGSVSKNWQPENFRQLAQSLTLPLEFAVGPDEEWPGAHRFSSLAETARWLASARVYVGNDSGITHLAAAVGIPVVAIFRRTDPQVWAPRGRNRVQVLTGTPGVDEVKQAIMDLI